MYAALFCYVTKVVRNIKCMLYNISQPSRCGGTGPAASIGGLVGRGRNRGRLCRAAGRVSELEGGDGCLRVAVGQVVELLSRIARRVKACPEHQHIGPAVAHLELVQLMRLVLWHVVLPSRWLWWQHLVLLSTLHVPPGGGELCLALVLPLLQVS